MPNFQYLAKKSPTETIEGVLEADSRTHVISHLTSLGYTPVRITETQTLGVSRPTMASVRSLREVKVPTRILNQFTRQFASLVRSQVSLLRALGILKEQTSHPRLRRILEVIAEEIRQGETLSSALEKYPRVFSPLYVSLTRSGEAGGMLDTVLDRLAAQADRDEEMRSKVRAALAYPTFVGVVGLFTVLFLLAFVMPKMIRLFDVFKGRLPLPTRILLALTDWVSNGWFWGLGILIGMWAVGFWMKHSQKGLMVIDRLSLHLPLVGVMIRQLETARFTRYYGMLLDQGVPILQATEVAIPLVKNRLIRQQLQKLPARLKEGSSLSASLNGFLISTPFVINTVAVGVEGGRVSEALIEVANNYEKDVQRTLDLMAALLEPAIILIVGSIVGFIVVAVLLPILGISTIAR